MCGSLKLTEFLFLVYFHFGACHWPILVFRLKRAFILFLYHCTVVSNASSQQESSWFKPQPGHSTVLSKYDNFWLQKLM